MSELKNRFEKILFSREVIIFFLISNIIIYLLSSSLSVLNYIGKNGEKISKDLTYFSKLSKRGKFSKLFLHYVFDRDGREYLKVALGMKANPPFSRRILYPRLLGITAYFLARIVDRKNYRATQLNLLFPVMCVYNFFFLLGGFYLLRASFKRIFPEEEILTVFFPLAFTLNPGVVKTAQFFMLDIPTYFVSALIFYFFVRKSYVALAFAIGIGAIFKELILLFSLLFVFLLFEEKKKRKIILICLSVTLLIFFAYRFFLKVPTFEVAYGWNLKSSSVFSPTNTYFKRHLGTLKKAVYFCFQILYTGGFLWIYIIWNLLFFRSRSVLVFIFLFIPLLIADLFLATSVIRILSVLYPWLLWPILEGFQEANS